MQCQLADVAYRYGRQWLFKEVNALLKTGEINLITGPNGAGKSTLLRLLAGALETEAGQIRFLKDGKEIEEEERWRQIALVAPYQELPEEFSLTELTELQDRFLPAGESQKAYREELTSYFGLSGVAAKPVREYSTGMKQKARIILAFASNRPICLLDEPGSNLDVESCRLLHDFLRREAREKLVIIASNDPSEIALGPLRLHLG